jgi:hypothetical protein
VKRWLVSARINRASGPRRFKFLVSGTIDTLRRIVRAYAAYYNEVRTHLSLEKNAPVLRTVQLVGQIPALLFLGGLHHRHVRI